MLAFLKHSLNNDFARLLRVANWDAKVRELMGMKPVANGGMEFTFQTIIRNLTWLDEETLVAINVVIVKHAHLVIGVAPSDKLKGFGDSFVVGTDVEYPVDLCLLTDALRTLIKGISRLSRKHGIGG